MGILRHWHHRFFSHIGWLAWALVALFATAGSQAQTVNWVSWTAPTAFPLSNGSPPYTYANGASGSLTLPDGSVVNVTLTGEVMGSESCFAVTPDGCQLFWASHTWTTYPAGTFTSPNVPNLPPNVNYIAQAGFSPAAAHRLTFSRTVVNVVMNITSLGGGPLSAYEFDRPFTILSQDTRCDKVTGEFCLTASNSNRTLTGKEGSGTIQFLGNNASIGWTVTVPEYFSGFNVGVTSAAAGFSVGGTVTGLGAGKSLVLRNNGGDDLSVGANGAFTFDTKVLSPDPYVVTVATQPAGQACSVTNAAGTVTANVTNVLVSCRDLASVRLQLAKAWVNGRSGDTTVITSSGGAAQASLTHRSTGGAGGVTVAGGTPVAIAVGDEITLDAETFLPAGADLLYASAVTCDNAVGNIAVAKLPVRFTVIAADDGKLITCTYSNTRRSVDLTLRKTWSPGSLAGNATTITTSGLSPNASTGLSTATAAGNTTTGTAVTAFAGDTVGLPAETLSNGTLSNYTTNLSCTGAAGQLSGSNGQQPNTVVLGPTDTSVTCTYTNTLAAQARLQLAQAWVNGKSGDAIAVTTSGGSVNATVGNQSTGGSASTTTAGGTPVAVRVGDVIQLPAQAFTPAVNAANYASTVSCTNASGGVSNAALPASFTVTAADLSRTITCTYTSTRKSAQLRLAKTWAAGSVAGNATTITTTGLATNATTGLSTASAAGNTTTGTAVTAFAGDTVGLPAETLSIGTLSNYATTLSCTGAANAGSSSNGQQARSFVVAGADANILCTYSNNLTAQASLQLAQAWVNGKSGDAIAVTTSGGSVNATLGNQSTGGSASTTTAGGTPVAVRVGDVIQLPAQAFTPAANAANYVSAVSCSNASGGVSNAPLPASFTVIAADLSRTITCTYTSTRKSTQLRLAKTWSAGSVAGNATTITTTGLATNATTGLSTASAAGNTTTGTAVTAFAGDTVGLPAETLSIGTLSNYATSLSCTGAANAGSSSNGQQARSFVVAGADANILCTYSNNLTAQASLQLAQAWVNGKSGDAIAVTTSGGSINATLGNQSTGGSASTTTAGGTPVAVRVGDVIQLPAQAFTPAANAGNYASTVSCTNASGGVSNAALPASITVTAADLSRPITCTYTSTRKSAQLRLAKTWSAGSVAGNATTITTTGLATNASTGLSTASAAGNTTTGTAVTAFAGDTVGLPAETLSIGTLSNYATTLSCTGAANAGSSSNGQQPRSFVVASTDTNITCTYSNNLTAQARLQLVKTWVNGNSGDAISVATTGGTNNASLSNQSTGGTASTTTAGGTPVQVRVGDVIQLPVEAFTPPANAANYGATVSCDNASGGVRNAPLPTSFTVAAGDLTKTITCTYTNTRKTAQLQLAKAWVNGRSGDAITASTSGGANSASIANTSTGGAAGNTTAGGTPVAVRVGETITLAAEVFSPAANAQNYANRVSCNNATGGVSNAGLPASFTVGAADMGNTITCTYTSTRKSAQLTLAKTWAAGSTDGHTTSLTTTGLVNNASTGPSVALAAGRTTTGTAVTVFAGETIGLPAETLSVGNVAGYTTRLGCTGASGTLSGSNGQQANSLAVGPLDAGAGIACTYTNTAQPRLQLVKVWVNGKSGDAISVTTTGGTNNASLSNTSTGGAGGNTTAGGTPVNVKAGDVVKLPAETFAPLANAANYTHTVSCNNATNPLVNASLPASFTVGTADASNTIVCTYTSTRKSALLSLAKTWGPGSYEGDATTLTTTGLVNNASTGRSVALRAGNTTTGLTVAVYAGETATFPAQTLSPGSLSNYNTQLSCTGAINALSGRNGQQVNTLAISPLDASLISCAYMDSPINFAESIPTLSEFMQLVLAGLLLVSGLALRRR